LGIAKGEVFGLLGPNGAGKTTTLSILTGALQRSGGISTVGGHDTQTQMSIIQTFIGVCPQFDCCFDDLTVQEHLQFYARLKGIPQEEQRGVVQQSA
jgi:ABC-type multidrug transport system ATPase subunit